MANSDLDTVLAKLLEQEASDEMAALKRTILRRIAMESDIKQARIPAPMNITEIGGYYNLMQNDDVMRRQLLATVLGLPYISEE